MISLGTDEVEVLRLQKQWGSLVVPCVVGLICMAFTFGLSILWPAYKVLRFRADEIVLTNQKFHVSVGLISKEVLSIPLRKINNVSYQQGFIGRIFNYGTIYVQSAAAQGTLSYGGIINPEFAKSQIEQAIEQSENK